MCKRADLILAIAFINPHVQITGPYLAHLLNYFVNRFERFLSEPPAGYKKPAGNAGQQYQHAFQQVEPALVPLYVVSRNQDYKISLVIVIINSYGLPVTFSKLRLFSLSHHIDHRR